MDTCQGKQAEGNSLNYSTPGTLISVLHCDAGRVKMSDQSIHKGALVSLIIHNQSGPADIPPCSQSQIFMKTDLRGS